MVSGVEVYSAPIFSTDPGVSFDHEYLPENDDPTQTVLHEQE